LRRFSLFLVLLLVLPLPTALQAQFLDYEEEVFLSFRYQGGINEIIVAYLSYGEFYLPLTELFQLLGIEYTIDPASLSVSGTYLENGPFYRLDMRSNSASIGDKYFLLPASHFLAKEVDFYLVPEVFEQVFGLTFTVDMSRLILKLETKDIMPVVARQQRLKRYEIQQLGSLESAEFPLIYDRERRILDGGLMDYTLYSSMNADNQVMNLNLSLGGEVLLGDIEGSIISSVHRGLATLPDSGIVTNTSFMGSDLRWRYVRPLPPWFTTLSLGQNPTSGLLSQSFQGIVLSNEPVEPKVSFDNYIIDGFTEPESDIEIYQDNRLVDVGKADEFGYYRFTLPLNYGTSDIKQRIYNKQGRVIEQDRRIQVPYNFLPPGDIHVHMQAGKVENDETSWEAWDDYGQVSINAGLTNWLSNRLAIEYMQDAYRDRALIHNQLSARIFTYDLVSLDIAPNAFYRLTNRVVYPSSSSWSLVYTHYDGIGPLNKLGLHRDINFSFYYPFQLGSMPVTFRYSGFAQEFPEYIYLQNGFYVNSFLGRVRIRTNYRGIEKLQDSTSTDQGSFNIGFTYSVPRRPDIRKILQGSYFRLEHLINTKTGKASEIRLQILKQVARHGRFQFSLNRDLVSDATSVEFTYMLDLERVRSTSSLRNVSKPASSGSISSVTSLSQTVRGSVALDRDYGQWIWDNRQQVGRAGVTVRMYVDENGSDSYDQGEEIIPGNAVRIHRSSSRQISKDNISRLTQLQPYRKYNFVINEAYIRNPTLVPRYKEFAAITDPNRYKRLDIPFITTGIIDGQVRRLIGGELIPVGGLRIYIASEDGEFEKMVRTFGDGTYYSMEIPPGHYNVSIDEGQLLFLGAHSKPAILNFEVKALPEGDFVEGLDFILE